MRQRPKTLVSLSKASYPRQYKRDKRKAFAVAHAFDCLEDDKRAHQLRNCANRRDIEVHEHPEGGEYHVSVESFRCKSRHCPACQRVRAMQYAYQYRPVLATLQERHPQALFYHLTLTIENVEAADLSAAITRLSSGMKHMRRLKPYKRAVLGDLRSIEVTHADNGTYHPHVHALLALHPDYMDKSKARFLTYNRWREMWAAAVGQTEKTPQIRFSKVRPRKKKDAIAAALVEVVKYAVKPSDLYHWDGKRWNVDSAVLEVLYKALKGRRLISYGGEILRIARELKKNPPPPAEAAETADAPLSHYHRQTYVWSHKHGDYVLVKEAVMRPETTPDLEELFQ